MLKFNLGYLEYCLLFYPMFLDWLIFSNDPYEDTVSIYIYFLNCHQIYHLIDFLPNLL